MSSRILRRRDVLKLIGSASASVLLIACAAPAATPTQAPVPTDTPKPAAAQPANTPAPAAPTNTPAPQAAAATATPNPLANVPIKPGMKVVEWWWPWTGLTGLQALANLATDFNNTHTNFQVKALVIQDEFGGQPLLTAIAGGTPPSVETGGTGADFWLAGGAQPIDDRLKASKVIDFKDMPDALVAATQLKGKTYGVPQIEAYLRHELCVNVDLFEKNGRSAASLQTAAVDFDTLYTWAKDMSSVDATGVIKAFGFDPLDAEGSYFGGYWNSAFNYKFYDDANSKYVLNTDTMIEMLTQIQRFVDIVGAEKRAGLVKSTGTWTESPTAMFPSGLLGMQCNGYWAPGELSKSAPSRKYAYGWMPVPVARKDKKIATAGGHMSVLPKGAPSPDEGFQIIEYLNTPAACDIIFNTTGWLPAVKSYISKVNASKYPGLDFFIRASTEANEVQGPISSPVGNFVGDQYNKAVDAVTYHQTTPKDAAKQLQDAADTEMKQRFPNGF